MKVWYWIRSCFDPLLDRVNRQRRDVDRSIRRHDTEVRKLIIKNQHEEKKLLQAVSRTDDSYAKLLAARIHATNVRIAAHTESVVRSEHMITGLDSVKQSIQSAQIVHTCADIMTEVHGTTDMKAIAKDIQRFDKGMTDLKEVQDNTHEVTKSINGDNVTETEDDIIDRVTKKAEMEIVDQMPTVTSDDADDELAIRLRKLNEST